MKKLFLSRKQKTALVRVVAAIFSIVILGISLPANIAQAIKPKAGELGIGVEILPTLSSNPAQLGANSELWFAIEPGQSAQRKFRIISTSDIVQRITFELWQVTVVDGERTLDRTTRSPSEQWATFSPPSIDLRPGAREEVTMTYSIPDGTDPAVFESYLRILVSARDATVNTNPNAGVQAVIKGALAFRKSVWLGIGDAANLTTDFEIRGVAGWLTDKNEKAVRVLIRNTGDTPIRPLGSVQLADPLFADNKYGPFEFRTNTINPGDSAYGEAIVDSVIADGRWSVFVQATQGSIRKTAKFDQELKFDRSLDELGSLRTWFIRIGIGVFGLCLVALGYRLIRGKRKNDQQAVGSVTDGSVTAKVAVNSLPSEPNSPEVLVDSESKPEIPFVGDEPEEDTTASFKTERIVVQISGAVRNPGLYEVDEDIRVGEVIELAGGAWVNADTGEINLARKVVDGEQIVIPTRVVLPRVVNSDSNRAALDLNLASIKQLAALPGVGQELGAAIVAYRSKIGRFTSIEQLLEVKGIGPRKLEAMKKQIRI